MACLGFGCGDAPVPTDPVQLADRDTQASIANETRHALVLQSASAKHARFDVRVPESATFRFGFGVPNASIAQGHGPIVFQVFLEADEQRTRLALREVDPQKVSDRRWFDGRIDLAAWEGQQVTLELSVTPGKGGDLRTLGAFSDPTIESGVHADSRPNLLIVSIDTLRAQNISSYGYARKTTPAFDAIAAGGTLFEDAITTSTTTAPSHMSLFTGLYPVRHGIRTGYNEKRPAPVIASTLRDAGYRTAAFTENGFLVRERGFGEGFLEYTENHGTHIEGPGEVRKTFKQAERWLRSNTQPFFLFVHTYQTHAPFWPPPDYENLFADEPVPGVTGPVMQRLRDDYDREIRYTDDILAELVAALDATGLRASTLLIILSDHGEEFGEHGAYQHGTAVFEETLRIPILFSGPGVPAGLRIPDAVSLIDVFPTVVDLLKLDPPAAIDGLNLAPLMRGEETLQSRALFAEAAATHRWTQPFRGKEWNPPLLAARTSDEKFILHRPWQGEASAPQHYDLRNDNLEKSPLPMDASTLNRANALIDGYLGEDDFRPVIPKPEGLDPEERRRLELLGYIDSSEDVPVAPQ